MLKRNRAVLFFLLRKTLLTTVYRAFLTEFSIQTKTANRRHEKLRKSCQSSPGIRIQEQLPSQGHLGFPDFVRWYHVSFEQWNY